MSEIAIKVENLSKRYRIGLKEEMHDTLVGALTSFLRQPAKNLRRLQSLTTFRDDGHPPLPSDLSPLLSDILWALRDVSFDVHRGEVVGIIGRNGAGKSTLLKILSRITHPTSGRVTLNGRVSSLLEVGTGFHPELTGRENIYLNGTILGMTRKEIDHKFDEILDFSGVEKFIDTPVKFYSSGMRVRLAFSVAAHLEQEILMVDEVLAVGDAEFQKKCLGKMGEVARVGRTVLFVSHNMQAIRQLCPRAIWLDEGRVTIDSSGDVVVNKYLQDTPHAETLGEVAQLISQLPSDPTIRLNDIVIQQGGHTGNQVVTGLPVEILIDYDVLEVTSGLKVYIVLCDTEGTTLFRSFFHGDAPELPMMNPGRYVSRATIPADFLAPIAYHVVVSASIHNVRHCFPEGITVKLFAKEAGRLTYAFASSGAGGIKLAPFIPWTTELYNSDGTVPRCEF